MTESYPGKINTPSPLEQTSERACPAVGNRCSTCLRIAETAMVAGLVEKGWIERRATSLVEKIPVRGPLEEAAPLTSLTCAQRQERADLVGRGLADKYQDGVNP